MKTPLPPATVTRIVELYQQGYSYSTIKELCNVSLSSISKYTKNIQIVAARPSPGSAFSLTARQKNSFFRAIKTGQLKHITDMQHYLQTTYNKTAGKSTIYSYIKKEGFISYRAPKKPKIKIQNQKRRLQFAKEHKDWTIQDWKKVLFSDETRVNRIGPDPTSSRWYHGAQPSSSRQVRETMAHGGGSIMVWACITPDGAGYITQILGTMDSDTYCHILESDLIDTLEYYGLEPGGIIYQQDGDPKHTSKKALETLRRLGIETLDWPPSSPDLNPIENAWAIMKQQLAQYENPADSIEVLFDRVSEVWNNFDQLNINSLYESMPARMQACIKAKGGATKY